MGSLKIFKNIQSKMLLYFVTLFFVISLVTGIVQYKINTEIQFRVLEMRLQD